VAQAPSEVRRRLRAAMEAGDHAAVVQLLAPDVIVRSPIIGSAFEGADAVGNLFAAIIDIFEGLEYTGEAEADGLQVLVFRARVRDRTLEGVDLIRVDADGRIAEMTVLMRPMTDLALLANELGPRLARRRGRLRTFLMRVLGPPVPLVLSLVERLSPRLIFLRGR
jgi:SnoaL-like protein